MPDRFHFAAGRLLLVGALWFCVSLRAEDYVALNATIESVRWQRGGIWKGDPVKIHCIVGTNDWQMDGTFASGLKTKTWFTGTNLVMIREFPQSNAQDETGLKGGDGTNSAAHAGRGWIRKSASVDGNPGRPVRVVDLMNLEERIAWLAFCSAPALRREGHVLFPPSDLWKETIAAKGGFRERTELFMDDLGLPRTVRLQASNGFTAMQYGIVTSTNVNEWDFPREFYLTQYWPGMLDDSNIVSSNHWEVDYVAHGILTSIGPGTKPEAPPANATEVAW